MSDTLYIFGSCSGTEPYPNRHHCSFAIAHDGGLYWFDAGETCSHTAYTMGLDLRDIRAVFVSHPHMDHVGGLANLFWTVRKLHTRYGGMEGKKIDLHMPDTIVWPAIRTLLTQTEGDFAIPFEIAEHRVSDGPLYSQNGVKVEALHNYHLPALPDGSYRSYSYRIEVGGKVIVFSGDVKNYAEIAPLLPGADILLAETGHHRPAKVCRELIDLNCIPKTLMFIHHGRAILDEGQSSIDEAKAFYSGEIRVLNDAETIPL